MQNVPDTLWNFNIRLFLLNETSNRCHQATHNILLAHFEYPDCKNEMDILWIRIFVSALVLTLFFQMRDLPGFHSSDHNYHTTRNTFHEVC